MTPRATHGLLVFLMAWTFVSDEAVANLISEGDFQNSPTLPLGTAFGGWTYEDNAGVLVLGLESNKAVRLESGGAATSDPTASQTVPGLSVGDTYLLEWDWRLRINAGGYDKGWSFGIFLDNQSFGSALFLSKTLSEDFLHSSVEFTATSTEHTFIFAGELDARSNGAIVTEANDGRTDASYYLDNVSLTAVPEPHGLLSIILAWIGLFRQRSNICRNA